MSIPAGYGTINPGDVAWYYRYTSGAGVITDESITFSNVIDFSAQNYIIGLGNLQVSNETYIDFQYIHELSHAFQAAPGHNGNESQYNINIWNACFG